MKILIAPDSFKESMTAYEATWAIEKGIKEYSQDIQTIQCPLADGGEGTLETLIHAMNGIIEYEEVTGPLFQKIHAPIGYVDDIAIIECAKVCGLELLDEKQKDPHHTTSYGLGELMEKAMKPHVRKIMICLGGSATNDGGIGMLAALGVRFYNQQHEQVTLTMSGLKDIQSVDISGIDERLKQFEIIGVCDVNNPLCGQKGATAIYGPQKGVLQSEIMHVDQAMAHYASLIDTLLQYRYCDCEGAGAAGGLGYALLSLCHAKFQKGFDVMSEVTHLEEKIQIADCVIVGEGKIDQQTQYGKTPYGVLCQAKKYHKPTIAFAGKVSDLSHLKQLGFAHVYQITPSDMDLATALKQGQINLKECVKQHMEEIINEIQS